MNTSLDPARRDELIKTIAGRLRALNLDTTAILCLQLLEPFAFLSSQLLLAAQPFIGVAAGSRLAQDLALLAEKPENLRALIAQLERPG